MTDYKTPAQVKVILSLGDLDNTSDADKPVSTAGQTALDLKADASALTTKTDSSDFADSLSKNQGFFSSGAYTENFSLLDLSEQTVRNLNDAATPVRTVTKVAGGLQIALSTGSRTFAFSTANKVGAAGETRIRYKGVISTGTTGRIGFSVYDGVNITGIELQSNNGRISVINTGGGGGVVFDGVGPLTANLTVEIEAAFDALTKTAHFAISIDGGAPYSFALSNVAIGDVELLQRNSCTVVHSLIIESLGENQLDAINLAAAPEIEQVDRNAINASAGFLATLRRSIQAGWTETIPNGYEFYKSGTSYFSSIDLRPLLNENDPDVMTLYVDVATGSDGNIGTAALPLKSLNVAAGRIGAGSKAIIRAKGGLYPYTNCFRGTIGGTINQIVSWDGQPIVSSMHDNTLSWALDTGTTYVATQSVGNFSTVFDADDLTSDGDYGALELAADLTACRATQGTWFSTGTSRYVNLHDGRAPDADLRCYVRIVGGAGDIYGVRQADGSTLYMEDLSLEGGQLPLSSRTAGNTNQIYTYAKRCNFKYGGGNGVNTTADGLAIMQDCVAAWNGDDGFNWKQSPFGGDGPLCIEIDCTGRRNGRDTEGTNNGSTGHGNYVIRVNGNYHDNQDRNVHDIDGGGVAMLSLNFGCVSGPSQTGDASFACGIIGGSDVGKMWLDGCTAIGGAKDIEANASTTIFTSGFTGSGTQAGDGTIESYTP